MNEDAIAPVIAVMLLLAIGVTFFSVYATTYLPALKQQAEVEHLEQVASEFLKFSSDIDNAIATAGYADHITYSGQIPLGGGDILINSFKSSGTIRIQNKPLGDLIIIAANDTPKIIPLSLVHISYQPVGNFWIDQGYTWQDGYVNVTKQGRNTPLQYYTTDDPGLIEVVNNFANSLVTIQDNDTGTTGILQIIRVVAGNDSFTSGNGIARCSIRTENVNTTSYQNVTIHFRPSGENSESNIIDSINSSIRKVNTSLSSENNYTVKIIEIQVKVN